MKTEIATATRPRREDGEDLGDYFKRVDRFNEEAKKERLRREEAEFDALDKTGLPFFDDEEDEPTDEELEELDRQWAPIIKEVRNTTRIYDPGSRKKMELGVFEEKYGTDEFSSELLKVTNKEIDKLPVGMLKKITSRHNNLQNPTNIVKSKPKKTKAKKPDTKRKTKQFLQVPHVFMNEKVEKSKCHQNHTALLMFLLMHRSWEGKTDKHDTYDYWYLQKGKIVASRSIKQLAKDINVGEKTIRRYLNELEANGDIIKAKGVGGERVRQNVYILGEVNSDGDEVLYCFR